MMYEAVIGLEIHAELKTNTKIYCGCKNSFGAEPNTQVCPVCMGLPGALPVLNKKVVDLAIKAGLALSCSISKTSNQDRKNYFYPDLPKGYQISQNDFPLCSKGYIELNNKKINIKRIHIEEDAGKLIHKENNTTVIDFNRCGVPLIEIVTEPDIRSADEAVEFLGCLKEILEYLDVSDCKMQEGSLRCDINISLRPAGSNILGTRCEIKNLNSLSAVKSAIDYEIERQKALLVSGENVVQETRRWDDTFKKTISMRSKENYCDYRYFPEPDLLPITVDDNQIESIRKTIERLPKERRNQYINDYNMSQYDAEILTSKKALADFFESCVTLGAKPKNVANWLMGDVSRILNEKGLTFEDVPFPPNHLVKLIDMIDNGTISNNTAKTVLAHMFSDLKDPEKIVLELGILQISDKAEIATIVKKVILANPKPLEDYKNGNKRAFGFLMGQAMKMSGGKANPEILNNVLYEFLNNQR